MRTLPDSLVFTTATARELGWTDSALHCAVLAGRLTRLRRGVYSRPETEGDPIAAAHAVAAAYPDLPSSHVSAARLLGIPVVGRHRVRPEVTVPPRSNADLPGVHPYRARVRTHDLMTVDGILVTTPARTALDIARHYPLTTAVSALDYGLHEELATAEDLLDVFGFCRTWPGVPAARRALALCDSRAESPLESVSRLVIRKLGLPDPEAQTTFLDRSGAFVGRGDFYWDEFGVVGEADGQSKYTDAAIRIAENDREEGLDDTALEVTRWGWHRVWSERAIFERRLRNAFARGLARDRAGLARGWTAVPTPRISLV